jgi:hypothetical protein
MTDEEFNARWPRVRLDNEAELSAALVLCSSKDFGQATMKSGVVSATIYPLTAEQCERVAAMFADLAMKLRASEQDHVRFLNAIAADEREAA